MHLNPYYNHHWNCENLQLTNLMFAYDILLFSVGDFIYMDLMLQTFSLFAKSTGMKINFAKSKMFFGNVEANEKHLILNKYGFSECSFPFKYLGIPLSCKKLSICQYMPLINEIVGKINHWSTKLLIYAGRAQLVKSISFAMANYWLIVFPYWKWLSGKLMLFHIVYLDR